MIGWELFFFFNATATTGIYTLSLHAALPLLPVLAGLLPACQGGLAPIAWLAPGAVALALALPPTQYLVAVNRQRRALAVVLVATALAAVANHAALTGGFGLVGVAAATAASYAVYFLLVVAVSIWTELSRPERLHAVVMLAVALVPTLAVATALERSWPGATADVRTTLAKTAAVVAVWALTATFTWHRGGWREAFRKESQEQDR